MFSKQKIIKIYLHSFLSGMQKQSCLERVMPHRKQTKNFANQFSVGILPIFCLITIIQFSCKKDTIISDSSAKIGLSCNEILFDTVFTTIGSVTKQLKVYNPYKQKIKISSIILAGGTNSNFRINVDGTPGTIFNDIEIEPKDSIFIFVKVTVDPNNSNSPLVISDSLLFTTNGNQQKVKLTAWGQDAYYYTPNQTLYFQDGSALRFSYAHCKTAWKNDKPHVLYGYVVVDSDSTLTILQNTKVYMHKDAVLWVYDGGTLKVQGTMGNPVIFQGDRLEQYYQDKPGQWGEIWLSAGCKNNEINYAIIKNGYVGIQIDTTAVNPTQPTLSIENTIVENMGTAGILAQGTWMEAKNCIVSNCAKYAVVLNIGGKYDFKHCTIGNYWNYSNRQTTSLVLNNWYEDDKHNIILRNLVQANFGNCIVYGSLTEEVLLDKHSGATFNYNFDHCLLRTRLVSDVTFHSNCVSCLINKDPEFLDVNSNNYQLSSTSPAIDKGLKSIANYVPFDILRHNRVSNIAPDIGAYEEK